MLLIYTSANSPRFSYIAGVLFTSVVNVDFSITYSKDDFIAYDGPKINYSDIQISVAEIWIKPNTLLFEKDIQQQQISCFDWHGLKAFFKTNGDIPFDIFAASFYLISRYEEYLPHTKDEYGRYAHTNSLAHKEGFLHLPLVNMWVKELGKIITVKFPSFTIQDSRFTFIPTYDIDIAYAYKGKGWVHNIATFSRALFSFKTKQIAEMAAVQRNIKQDPFDTYKWLDELHGRCGLKPLYFFLVAANRGLYDKNVPPHSRVMQQIIKQHAEKYITGVHPSWQSGDNESLLKEEINTLRGITGKPVIITRQHYIRLTLPGTYRLLIASGIFEDYSMGYGSINGFRASVASAFYWYDLGKEIKTNLLIHPYCYMEANSYFEQHYTPQQAAEELQEYYNIVKDTNGQLITIFHNHFLTEQPQWLPWRKMYADFLQKNFKLPCLIVKMG